MIKKLPLVDIAGNITKEVVKVNLAQMKILHFTWDNVILTGQEVGTEAPVDVAMPTANYINQQNQQHWQEA
ncbi:hypothetical protein [Fructobacillus tropaeoli]|uniref:hypothetical protein n=1 Tax=Fructobacillus tropaeoli TaxID=709323 RepID=UPI002DAA4471|nr:unnamed protein product [Fructobacillus tropaeoli]